MSTKTAEKAQKFDENESDEFEDIEDDDENYDDYEEVQDVKDIIKIKSLFDDEWFDNVQALYEHELKKNNFNIVEIIRKYQMDMLSYIKMVNFIRKTKPSIQVFQVEYPDLGKVPWNNDDYFQTVIDDDPLLQFDIEEDLDVLKLNNNENSKEKESFQIINIYENKLKASESRIEELSDIVNKLRSYTTDLLDKGESISTDQYDDSHYVHSYSNYSIHLEMLQDKVRTETYMNAILGNKEVFNGKVVLDVGCGTGILSMFAAKAGAKLVIAVDMSDIIDEAIKIAEENGFKDRIVFLKGKVEEVQLPVHKVDIIISEWMGYFLIFESMLDSVIVARDKYLNSDGGIVLPNHVEMEIFGVCDTHTYEKNINFWSNVYGFKMNCMKKHVLKDAQIMTIKSDDVITDAELINSIDCQNNDLHDVSQFESKFSLNVNKDSKLTGLGVSFNTNFNSKALKNPVSFSTDPYHKPTHWEQTYFQLDELIDVRKGTKIEGAIKCIRNSHNPRSYSITLDVFEKTYHYRVE